MSRSHFQFECEGIEVEISGDWRYVEKMYRRIMRDIDAARPREESIQSQGPEGPRTKTPSDHVVWIVRFDPMMRRIYMTESKDMQASAVTRRLDPERIGTLYVEKETFKELFPHIHQREETLWAELTEEGRRRISQSSDSI